jgi:cytochrome P450
MTEITINDLVSSETLNYPHTFYGELREHERLAHFSMGKVNGWIIATTYAETIELLKDPRLVCDRRNATTQDDALSAYGGPLALFSQNMLGMDPPDQDCHRNPLPTLTQPASGL